MEGAIKHIDVRFHFLRDLTEDGEVELVHCNTQDQVGNLMTKPLKLDAFQKLGENLNRSYVKKKRIPIS